MAFVPHFAIEGACMVSPLGQPANLGEHSFSPMGSKRCGEHGRVTAIDSSNGLAICACQVKMASQTYMSRVPSLPEAFYGSTTSHVYPASGLIGVEPSALYPMKSLTQNGLKSASTSDQFCLNNLLATHPYGSFYPGLDLNNATRRKNATRETTSALKAWLYEHRKNPYPTKGEKIMLAIITRMTLTQVSTWFANARRRLKKETKMAWGTKDGEDENDFDGSSGKEDGTASGDSLCCQCSSSDEDEMFKVSDVSDVADKRTSTAQQISNEYLQRVDCANEQHIRNVKSNMDTKVQNIPRDSNVTSNIFIHCGDRATQTSSSKTSAVGQDDLQNFVATGTGNLRPKIWSISEIIGCKNDSPNTLPIGSVDVFSTVTFVESSGLDTSTSCSNTCSRSGTGSEKIEDGESNIV